MPVSYTHLDVYKRQFQDLGLDPGHGGIAGQLFGDQGLDLDAHLGEHPLVLGADVPLRLVLVQVKGLPGDLIACLLYTSFPPERTGPAALRNTKGACGILLPQAPLLSMARV